MFVTTDMVYETLNGIFATGKIGQDKPIFETFNDFLGGLGLDVALTTFHVKPWNASQSITSGNGNSLGIYIRTTSNFILNGFTEEGNWSGKYAGTELIKKKWKELAQHYEYPPAYYNQVSYVWFYDFEKCYLVNLVQRVKERLIRKIKRQWWRIKPAHIFTSSMPSFNIIYENKAGFDRAFTKGYPEKIKRMAVAVMTGEDTFRLFTEDAVKINFYYAGMEGISLYGLSRED